jgi:hypothetical protein
MSHFKFFVWSRSLSYTSLDLLLCCTGAILCPNSQVNVISLRTWDTLRYYDNKLAFQYVLFVFMNDLVKHQKKTLKVPPPYTFSPVLSLRWTQTLSPLINSTLIVWDANSNLPAPPVLSRTNSLPFRTSWKWITLLWWPIILTDSV